MKLCDENSVYINIRTHYVLQSYHYSTSLQVFVRSEPGIKLQLIFLGTAAAAATYNCRHSRKDPIKIHLFSST